MAKILINKDSLQYVLDKFFLENKNCNKKEIRFSQNKVICKFFVDRKDCQVDIHLLKNGINPICVGKNKELASILIKYLETKGTLDDQSSQQLVIKNSDILNDILDYIESDFAGKITITTINNRYVLTSFNNDKITITKNEGNILIQGKPYYTFNIVLTFIASLDLISFDEYVELGNQFSEETYNANIIRDRIKQILRTSYSYMEEAQLKSISGSFSFINSNIASEDYSSPLTGVFKALEGYIKKLLTQKFNFKLTHNLSPFRKDKKTGKTEIDLRTDIAQKDKDALYKLYDAYCDKRNVYTHSTVDPAQMRVIQNYKEAEELRDEILEIIEETYKIIFRERI